MTTSTTNPNRRTLVTLRTRIALAVAGLVVIVGSFLVGSGIAYAGSDTGPARRGQPCDKAGAIVNDRSGDPYICEQRPGDECKVWHAHRPKPGNWGQPSPCVCPSSSPGTPASQSLSASPKPSTSPNKSATAAGSPSITPVGNDAPILAVTGTDDTVRWVALAGAAMVLAGAGLLLAVGYRSRRTN